MVGLRILVEFLGSKVRVIKKYPCAEGQGVHNGDVISISFFYEFKIY